MNYFSIRKYWNAHVSQLFTCDWRLQGKALIFQLRARKALWPSDGKIYYNITSQNNGTLEAINWRYWLNDESVRTASRFALTTISLLETQFLQNYRIISWFRAQWNPSNGDHAIYPPPNGGGGKRQKVQIPSCRHCLRRNFGPIK